MTKIKGKNLIVKNGDDAIACARSCELSIDTSITEIADATSGAWSKYRAGKKGWTVSCSGLVDVSGGITSLTGLAGTEITLRFVNNSGETAETLSGQAIVKSIKLTGTIGNLAQYSAEFQGSGELV